MKPLLSVAMPTHNRGRYAIHAIRALLAIESDAIEIVVTDTSTNQELKDGLARFPHLLADPRLKLVHPAERLDMTGNHNAALALTTGEYVCLIGDDDSISREAIDAAAWAAEHEIDLIAPAVVSNYVWPDFRSRYFGAHHASRLYFARSMGRCRMVEASAALENALQRAAQGTDGLPKVYHGLVRRKLLEELRARTGNYFHGSSPDVSGAIGLAAIARRFMEVDYPLTVPGASGGSNTGRSALNQHKGELSAEAQTQKFRDGGWSTGVPRFFSVETVWAHAALETLSRLDGDLVLRFNYARLMGACRSLHPDFRRDIEAGESEACALLNLDPAAFARQVAREQRSYNAERWRLLARRALMPTAAGQRNYVDDLQTIAEAPHELYLYLQRRALSWRSTIEHFHPEKT